MASSKNISKARLAPLVRIAIQLTFIITSLQYSQKVFAQDLSEETSEAAGETDPAEQGLVEVESNNILPSDLANIYKLVPYDVRRPKWGHQVTIAYSQYAPINYEESITADFESFFGSAEAPLIELAYMYKYNFGLGSVGIDMAYGIYGNDSADSAVNTDIQIQIIRIGARYALDNIMAEPIIAPYVMGGAYTLVYDLNKPIDSLNGTTGVAGYFGAGVLFQMNWIDKSAAVEAYSESGIENTYLFIEARQYLASSEDLDPDFSTEFDLAAGLSLEF